MTDVCNQTMETLFAEWRKPLFAFIYRMVTRREDAEDLMQEVFIRCLRGFESFRREAQFKTWLFSIATRVCLDHLRNKPKWRADAQQVAEREVREKQRSQ